MRRTYSKSSTHYPSCHIHPIGRTENPLYLSRAILFVWGMSRTPLMPASPTARLQLARFATEVEQSFQSISFHYPDFRAQGHKQPSWKDTPSKKTDMSPESIVFFHPPTYLPLSPLVAKFMHWIWQRKGEIRCSHHHLCIQLRPHAQNDT